MTKIKTITPWGAKRFKSVIEYSKEMEIPEDIVKFIRRKEECYLESKVLIQTDRETRKKVSDMLNCNRVLSKGARAKLKMMYIMNFSGNKCYICDQKIEDDFNIDHVVPYAVVRSLGMHNSGTTGNTLPTHIKCNEEKGCRPPTPEEIQRAITAHENAGLQPSIVLRAYDELKCKIQTNAIWIDTKDKINIFSGRFSSRKPYIHSEDNRKYLNDIIDGLAEIRGILDSEYPRLPIWKRVGKKFQNLKKVLAKPIALIHKTNQ